MVKKQNWGQAKQVIPCIIIAHLSASNCICLQISTFISNLKPDKCKQSLEVQPITVKMSSMA